MTKWVVKGLIFSGYSVPYVYLAINDDASNRSMLCYGVMLIALMMLTLISVRINAIVLLIMGNVISFMLSYFLVITHQTEKWSWYFKPFSAIGILVFVSSIAWIGEMIYIVYYEFKYLRFKK